MRWPHAADTRSAGARSAGRGRIVLILAAAVAALLAAVAFARAVGILPAGLYTADYIFLAEGARRIALGEIPHVDFSAPVGALPFALMALARWVPALGPDLFGLHALMGAVVALPAVAVALRLRSAGAALGCLAIALLLALTPFNVEDRAGACDVNYNGIYNRHGAALLFVTFVALLAPPRAARADGLLFAWLIGAMALTKITYGAAGLAVLAVAALFCAARLRALGVAAAVLFGAAAVLEALTGLVSAYGRDLAEMGRLNARGVLPALWGSAWAQALVVLCGLALVGSLAARPLAIAAARLRQGGAGPDWRAAWHALEAPALAGACLVLTLWTESQSTGGAGLAGLAALAFAPGPDAGRWGRVRTALAGGVVLLTVGVLAEQTLRRGGCLLEQAPEYRSHPAVEALAPGMRVPPGRLVAAEAAARLWRDHRALADEAVARGFDFHLESHGAPVSFVADAILAWEAAERFRALGHGRPVRHVMTLGFVDTFTPLLGLPPLPGGKLALDPYRTLGEPTPAEAAASLAAVDAAFERTCATPLFMRQIADFFRPALEESFAPVVLTPCWTVHLRRKPPIP